ncbi:hypothetical protein ISCGN_024470 [Ixodes scapularis]
MGCDGGTIPRRDELVRTKQKPEQKDKDAEAVAKWKHCAVTQEELRLPIVSCELGRLYNKESVIECLLNKDTSCETAQHIRSLKDIVELNLTENPGYRRRDADKGDEYVDLRASRFICPIVGLEMNGKHKFCYLRQCGCVLSDRALKEVKSEVCHKCAKPFRDDDIVVLNGTDDEVAVLTAQMEIRRARAKIDKRVVKISALKLIGSKGLSQPGHGNDQILHYNEKELRLLCPPLRMAVGKGRSTRETDLPIMVPECRLSNEG